MKKIISLFLVVFLCAALATAVFATQANAYFVYDDAALLTSAEAAALEEKLSTISSTYNAQVVIVTVDSAEGMDVDEYLELVYDSMGFGYGDNKDGVLLLVCMDPRQWRILSNGYAGDAITSSDIDTIGDAFVPDLSDGNYAEAFDIFADQCEYYLNGYLNGFPFDAGATLLTCLIVGLVVGLIVVLIMRGQLKSVRAQTGANVYVKPGSMQVAVRNDIFLYRQVTRVKKESNSSSGRSSGGSRSTGGGSF